MNKIIKVEIKKALKNKITITVFVFSVVLVIYQVVNNAKSFNEFYILFKHGSTEGNPMFSSESLFCRWLGADVTSFETAVFFFLMPLLVALSYGCSWKWE